MKSLMYSQKISMLHSVNSFLLFQESMMNWRNSMKRRQKGSKTRQLMREHTDLANSKKPSATQMLPCMKMAGPTQVFRQTFIYENTQISFRCALFRSYSGIYNRKSPIQATMRSALLSLRCLSSSVSGGKAGSGSTCPVQLRASENSFFSALGLTGGLPLFSYCEGGFEIFPGALIRKSIPFPHASA